MLLAAGVAFATASEARADEDRRGLQIEGMVGVAGCLDGRVACHQSTEVLGGRLRPSFGTGFTAGFRLRWLLVGGLYRWGMFNPDYSRPAELDYDWGGQHTMAALLRPILPLWRFDLGLNLAPGFSRQVFGRGLTGDRDYAQGFAFLVGPTVTFYLSEHMFIGAEAEVIFNAQRRACQRRDGANACFRVGSDTPALGPTHQIMGGIVLGATFL